MAPLGITVIVDCLQRKIPVFKKNHQSKQGDGTRACFYFDLNMACDHLKVARRTKPFLSHSFLNNVSDYFLFKLLGNIKKLLKNLLIRYKNKKKTDLLSCNVFSHY